MNSSYLIDNSKVQHLLIDHNHAGRRIDNFLFTVLKGVPKSRIYRLLRKGEVRVNKSRVRQDYKLQCGDDIRLAPIRLAEKTDEITVSDQVRDRLLAAVIHESESLLVISKPPGLPVHSGSGFHYGVIEAMRLLRQDLDYLELVHRLDRDTSGCLLMAKTPVILRELNRMVKDDEVKKTYSTLLCGAWQQGEMKINQPLRKNVMQGGERMVQVDEEGRHALSLFRPVEYFAQLATLMEVGLITGRTHQIRVHASHSGHPVAGDDKYGCRESNKQLKKIGLRGLFLHARRLEFVDPASGLPIVLEASLPSEHEKLLNHLRNE